jgi:hypothetical protein
LTDLRMFKVKKRSKSGWMWERVKTEISKRVSLDRFGIRQPVAQVYGHFEVFWKFKTPNMNECKKINLWNSLS